jgi:hypothetical protein
MITKVSKLSPSQLQIMQDALDSNQATVLYTRAPALQETVSSTMKSAIIVGVIQALEIRGNLQLAV